jgi:hypothetical protein
MEETGKRTVAETSFENVHSSSPKKSHVDPAGSGDTPPWVQELLSSMGTQNQELLNGQNIIQGQIAEMNASLHTLQVDVNKQGTHIIELDSKVALNEDRLERLENMIEELRTANTDLQGEVDDLRGDQTETKGLLNEQIDRAMRDHITFYGVPKDNNEKHWDYESTTSILATWLASVTGKPFKYFDKAIERSHRGPANPEKNGPPPVHCKLRWRVAAEIRDLFIKRGHKIGGITIKDKFSKDTQSRINDALIYRKTLREAEGGKELKLKVDYPARLMIKGPLETKYTLKKAF